MGFKSNNNHGTYNLIISSNIYEYDIHKANISVLYDMGLISKELYTELYNAPRMKRQYTIGMMQKNNYELSKKLRKGVFTAVDTFIKLNNITNANIIKHSNDAIYTYGVEANNLKISDNIRFIKKNSFTSYMKINKLEFLYYYNQQTEEERIKVLGVKDYKMFNDSFLQLICTVFYSLEYFGYIEGVRCIDDIIYMYTNREYSIEFYRNFNGDHDYTINSYSLQYIDEKYKYDIDISYNLNILHGIRICILNMVI